MISPQKFSEAYEAGFSKTLRFLKSRGLSHATAEHLAQDAWGKGWSKRRQLRDPAAIVPWVNSIAFNLLRAAARRPVYNNQLPETPVAPKVSAAGIDAKEAVRRCGVADRELLWNSIAGYTSKELANLRDCSASNIRVGLLRLRRRLQAHLAGRPAGHALTAAT